MNHSVISKFLKTLFCAALAVLLILSVQPDEALCAVDKPVNWYDCITYNTSLNEDFVVNDIWYIKVKRPEGSKHGQVYAGGLYKNLTKLTVPAVIEYRNKKYDVLGINDHAFENETSVTSLVIEKGVSYIGKYAFDQCTELRKVSLPESATDIRPLAFSDCKALTDVNIPDTLKEIPDSMFFRCESLVEIKLGKNVQTIGNSAFASCRKLKLVTLNKKLTTISNAAFMSCESLKSLKLPNGLKTLGSSAFEKCTSLSGITIPKKVTVIQSGCFQRCDSLKTVKLPKNIKEIELLAFAYSENLERISGSNKKLKKIGDSAFLKCKSLKTISCPNIENIGEGAFSEAGIEKIDLGKKLTELGSSAFAETNLKEIAVPGSVKEIREDTFRCCYKLKKVIIGEGVETIEDFAFSSDSKLQEISFPKSLKHITYYGLYYTGWLSLQEGQFCVEETEESANYSFWLNGKSDYSNFKDHVLINDICVYVSNYDVSVSENGYWNTKYKETISVPKGTRVAAFTIGTERDTNKIVFPEGVEEFTGSIKCGDYYYDDPVTIELPSTLKSMTGTINGKRLISITIPENVEKMGNVFREAENLETVIFKGNKLRELENTFYGTTNLKNVVLPEGLEVIGDFCFENSGIQKLKLPKSVKRIGVNAFHESGLESIELNDGLETIDKNAFWDSKLKSLEIPETVTFIGQSIIMGTGVTKLTLPDNLEKLGDLRDGEELTLYVRKNSKTYTAVQNYLKISSPKWTVKTKK